MCAIIILEPGQSIKDEWLQNAVYNNWHSYGLVTRVGDALQIDKVVPESGEVSFEEVKEKLEANKEYQRILHLRHTTAGKTDLENCHPFDILYVPKTKKQVVFMHNGTMNEYKSKIYEGSVAVDDNSGPSDTQNFVNQVLIPVISGSNFGKGFGDMDNPLMRKILDKLWPFGNRGILITNDQKPLLLGTWTEKGYGDEKIIVSNNDYFEKVIRGPEKERRDALEDAKKKDSVVKTGMFHNLKDFTLDKKHGFYSLKDSPNKLLNDWEFYNRESCISVGYLTKDELEQIYHDKDDCIAVMEWAFTDYAKLYKEHVALQKKLVNATKKIATLVEESKSEVEKERKAA